MADFVNQTLGDYEVVAKLGQGGMGAVYQARDLRLQRLVALKVLPLQFSADENFVARFQREAIAAAQFSHTNLVQVYNIGESAGTHFIVMELVEGESLAQRIARKGRLDPREAIAVTMYVAHALAYAWNKTQLIHRDIKPANIFLSRDGEVKLGDLGLAKSLHSAATQLTQRGCVMGTPHYISPEQGRADENLDFRTDIYSLGCVLYHMLTGQTPYHGDSSATLIYQHVHEPPPALRAAVPDCPPALVQLVETMLAKNPGDRPASYEKLLAELSRVHGSVPAGPHVPASGASTPVVNSSPSTTPARLWVYVGGGLVALAILAGLLLWAPWKQPAQKAGGGAAPQPAPQQQAGPGTGPAPTLPKPTFADGVSREVAALPAEQQVARVVAKLKELNPGYDGQEQHKIEGGAVTEFYLSTLTVSNISPLRALDKLRRLDCWGRPKGPFAGPPQAGILEDLSPLRGLHLSIFRFPGNPVKDLSPLAGMLLVELGLDGTAVIDLAPLKGMPLRVLYCRTPFIKDFSPLRGISTLEKINDRPAEEFLSAIRPTVAGATADGSLGISSPPVADRFFAEVAALPAERQVDRVVVKLKELNPGYDGKESHKIEDGQVVVFVFDSSSMAPVKDITPIRAFSHLTSLICGGKQKNWSVKIRGGISDLTQLEGLQLSELNFDCNHVRDLSPLRGMPLKILSCSFTDVSDLAPLAGAHLEELYIFGTAITNLEPLRGMPLHKLAIARTAVRDISPLAGLKLTDFFCDNTAISDLSLAAEMPLKIMICDRKTYESPANQATLGAKFAPQQFNNTPVVTLAPRVHSGSPPPPVSNADRLKQLKADLEKGTIPKDAYDKKVKEILNGI